jgi:predicted N-acetyltransferase YhbS
MGCIVHPAERGTDLTPDIFAHVEARALESVDHAPDGARVVLQTTVLSQDALMREALRSRGFEQVREWVHFELELAEPPAVHLPQGVTIRPMDPRHDWPAVGAAMDEAFADHWGEMGPDVRTLLEEDEPTDEAEDEQDDLEDDPYFNSLGLCFVAEANGEVIGSCLCNARTVEWSDAGKLGSLSVRRAYRRLGVGRALTATALTEFHRRGIRRVITDTDSASFTGANRLYPRFGFRPYRFEYVFEKEIRPGKEWRALSVADLN